MSLAILDYGVGNIGSLVSSLKRIGVMESEYCVVSDPTVLKRCNKFILPGVGSFDHCINALKSSGFIEALHEQVILCNKPILGICAGAQIMGHSSEEGNTQGLGWIDITVRKFPESLKFRVPHLGWNEVYPIVQHSLLSGVEPGKRFYFSHSYYFKPIENMQSVNVLAKTNYNINFPCIVSSKNAYAIQFHPEKSHSQGLQVLKNYIQYV